MKETKVVKFGGSSLADANQFRKVADIILADQARRFVVASAPGKRFVEDIKVTDMLYNCYELASEGEEFEEQFNLIKERYNGIIEGLGIQDFSLDEDFDIIKGAFSHMAGRDYAASRGEFLNSKVLAKFLGFDFIDAAKYIFFNERGEFDWDKTSEKLAPKLAKSEYAVIPGFYGSMPNGTIKTFSRGGSDVTGSIVARAADAMIYENWTDVSGFLICDPRIVNNPSPINTITYAELRELAYMGATVLHEDAIFPVRAAGIPVNIKNTNCPQDRGTMIVSETAEPCEHIITGIAGKRGFCSVNIEKDMMNSEIGFGRRILQAFEDNGISFEHVPSGIDTMTVFVHQDEFMDKEQNVVAAIHRLAKPDMIDIEGDLALIAVVGRGMRSTRGTAGRIFSALAHANINVKMIDQGSSELNIIIGVSDGDFENAIRAIYNMFVLVQL